MIYGTHDSAAYTFDYSIPCAADNKVAKIAKCAPLRRRLTAVSQTQGRDIAAQLRVGARALDLRVAFLEGTFYCAHTFCCVEFEEILEQVKSFTENNSAELFLLIKPDWDNRSSMRAVERNFIDRLELFLDLPEARAITIYYQPLEGALGSANARLLDMAALNTIWFNTQTPEEFSAAFARTEFTGRDVLCCVSTPSCGDTKWYQWLTLSLEKGAAELLPVATALLAERAASGRALPYICTFDFLTEETAQQK